MQNAFGLALDLYPDAVGFFDYVAIGNNVSLGIHDDAGAERALTQGAGSRTALPALAAEEAVKEIVERVLVLIVGISTPAVWVLDGGFSINVDDGGFELLGNLGELIGKLLRRGNGQRRGVSGGGSLLTFLAANGLGNHGADEDAEGQCSQDGDGISQTVGFQAQPKAALVQFHKCTSSQMKTWLDYTRLDAGTGVT